VGSLETDADEPRPAGFRRAPFRSTSVLRAAGEQTRRDVLAAAREVFGERGYHAATVEEIAGRCGRTGATVYQYFSGKAEIYRVFVDELGVALLRHARALEPVTPDADGRARLGVWLAGLEEILRVHALTFALWSAVEGEGVHLIRPAQEFVTQWTRLLSPRLGASGASALPYALLVVSENVWELHAAGGWGSRETDLHEGLTRFLHRAICAAPVEVAGLPAGGPTDDPGWPGLRRPAGPRAARSLERMVEAAGFLIARQGVDATSMAQIAERAGVRPASLYTYWADKTHLLATMSARADPVLEGVVAAAESLVLDLPHLTAWVGLVVRDQARVAGVLHWWLTQPLAGAGTAEVQRRRAELATRADRALARAAAGSPAPPLAALPELRVLVAGTLTLPRRMMVLDGWTSDVEVVATITGLLAGVVSQA
jgi:AcrR family transcriptional regulator